MWKKIFFALCLFFISTANVSAAPVSISEDNLKTFVEKSSAVLKAGDPNSFLDMPVELNEFEGIKNFIDKSIKTEDGTPIEITYTVKDDKVFAVVIGSDKYDENIKNYFDGLSIVFLKSLGLTDEEIKGLLNEKIEITWQKEGFISRLNKKFIVRFVSTAMIIIAEDK